MFFASQPTSGAQRSFGLDLGTQSAKAMVLSKNGARLDVDLAGSFEIPGDLVENGVVTNPKALGKVLSSYLKEQETAPDSAVFSVPSNLAVLRWVNLPKLTGDELRSAARYKVKRHLPFHIDGCYIEASQPKADAAEESQSLVVAIPRAVVDSRAEALLYAGIEPIRAELEGQAILRVIERRLSRRSALWRDASLTIIDLGATNTHMYVVQNQRLQFIRGVKIGARMFEEAIGKSLGIAHPIAAGLLKQPDTSLFSEGILSLRTATGLGVVNLRPELEKLTREFMRLMRYFRSLHPERSYAGILDHAVLCGGLAGLPGLGDYLEENLGLRVEIAQPIAGIMTRFTPETFSSVSHRSEAFTVAMGLALAGLGTGHANRSGKEDSLEREFVWARSA